MHSTPPSMSAYWRFYWPLAVTGMMVVLSTQAQNAILARYPQAMRELAAFAMAGGVFAMAHSVVQFMPQFTNVFVRSPSSLASGLRFAIAIVMGVSIPLALLTALPIGEVLLGAFYSVDGDLLVRMRLYLAWMLPLILLDGVKSFCAGLLAQMHRTRLMTVINAVGIATLLGSLVWGFSRGWSPLVTVSLARLLSSAIQALASAAGVRDWHGPGEEGEGNAFGWRHAWSFYWPMALTSLMFNFSRPILFAFVIRAGGGEAAVAALRVSFGFAMIFQNLINQFRIVFVNFGALDPAGARRFMWRTLIGIEAVMLAVALTPLGEFLFRDVIGVDGELLKMAREAFLIQCAIPVIMAVRNYHHGMAMVARKTRSMGAGALLRNGAVAVSAAVLWKLELLTAQTAAFCLVLGFLTEALTVRPRKAAKARAAASSLSG